MEMKGIERGERQLKYKNVQISKNGSQNKDEQENRRKMISVVDEC